MQKSCERCGAPFSVRSYRSETARFCSRSCRARWVGSLPNSGGRGKPRPYAIGNKYRCGLRPANAFPVGHTTWNKGLKGIHQSPASEFKPGHQRTPRAEIGTVSLRRTHDGNVRAFVKIEQPNKWKLRAVKAWEDHHGRAVPRGHIIHHDDRDTLNDSPSNLICLTKSEHASEHFSELTAARRGVFSS